MPDERITSILQEIRSEGPDAWQRLTPLVYGELRRQASQQLRRQGQDPMLQTSALVNEAYLRLVGEPDRNWQNRQHFYAVCAQVMRRILVDAARRRKSLRRNGGAHIPLGEAREADLSASPAAVDWLALDEALRRLAILHRRQHQVVELHYFVGLGFEEIAEILGVTFKTVQRDWVAARTWLYGQLASAK